MNIYIPAIIRPGTWLQLPDPEISREVEQMLYNMEDKVAEASITLSLFEAANSSSSIESNDDQEKVWEIRKEVRELVKQEFGDHYHQDYDRYSLECDLRILRRKTELGIVPRSYKHKVPFIHAHSFIYAVDSFGKFLDAICSYPNLPGAVTTLKDKFYTDLPTIRKIRNSALHIEDRSRGYGSPRERDRGIRMQTNGFLGLSNLEGSHLCYTIDDGTYQRVSISSDTLGTMVEILNQLLSSFEWEGPPRVSP